MRRHGWIWNEACSYCKGYPDVDRCYCTRRYKLRRLRVRLWRRMHRRFIKQWNEKLVRQKDNP